jgi:hypothetical protein
LRKNVRVSVVAVIVVAAAIGGLLFGSAVFPNLLNHNAAGREDQGLLLSGIETIKVISPSGAVLSTFRGPDPISTNVMNAIAGCATGISQPASGDPSGVFNSCEDWIGVISLWTDAPGGVCTVLFTANPKVCTYVNPVPATNTLTPLGCTTGGQFAYGSCTGWITEATFGPTTFTSTSCGKSCGVEEVIGASPTSDGNNWAFDTICASTFNPEEPSVPCLSTPIATVAPLDSLLVTIQFSVT